MNKQTPETPTGKAVGQRSIVLSDSPRRNKGIVTFEFSDEEKEEVADAIRSQGPEYQNSTIVLDKSDMPEELKDRVSFEDRDKDEIHDSSRELLSQIRRHKDLSGQISK